MKQIVEPQETIISKGSFLSRVDSAMGVNPVNVVISWVAEFPLPGFKKSVFTAESTNKEKIEIYALQTKLGSRLRRFKGSQSINYPNLVFYRWPFMTRSLI